MDRPDISDLKMDLNDEELSYLQTILSEVAETGTSQLLDQMWSEDYEEIPVDVRTFITDKRYLGETFVDEDGSLLMYDYWLDFMEKIFSPNSGVFEVALSGAIGLGKSTCA